VSHPESIDPADLAVCLRVLDEARALPEDHPDAVAVRRAASGVYKAVRKQRRVAARQAVLANDQAVTAATATGAPGRIDDETAGIPLTSSARGASAGTLIDPRACYICKERYRIVDAFYHQLCPRCAEMSHARREARTDLIGRRALLTGGRAKIGMYIALRLLRDGAHTTITTRFPRDAARRFAAMPDSGDWLHRLRHHRHRPPQSGAGDRPRGLGRRPGAPGHPHQQRLPDRAPQRRVVCPARRGRGRRPARRAAARDAHPRHARARRSRSRRER